MHSLFHNEKNNKSQVPVQTFAQALGLLSFADGASVAVGAVTVLVFPQPKRDNSMMRTNANEKKRFFIICAPIYNQSKMQGHPLRTGELKNNFHMQGEEDVSSRVLI